MAVVNSLFTQRLPWYFLSTFWFEKPMCVISITVWCRMTNKHIAELRVAFACLVKDMMEAFPELRSDLVKDQVRLERMVQERGLPAFLVDLPRLGKHLDRCLDQGRYIPSNLPMSKPVGGGVKIPHFLRGLYYLIFEPSGLLKENYDESAVFFLRQFFFLAKKFRTQCSGDKISAEVEAFVSLDNSLPLPNPFWDGNDCDVEGIRSGEIFGTFAKSATISSRITARFTSEGSDLLAALDFVSTQLGVALGSYDPADHSFKHGPGAVSNMRSGMDKYKWSNWSVRLESVFPIADYGFHSYAAWAEGVDKAGSVPERGTELVIGSREPVANLIDVPKTFSKPRLIASESTEQQWCQQNIWCYFRSRVRNSWIGEFVKFDDQTYNQELARKGSKDDSVATVDLSSASDCVTPELVGHIFQHQAELLCALQASRTRLLAVPGMDTAMQLKKFSTMGSATTFPVESLAFLVIVVAAAISRRKLPHTLSSILGLVGEVSVFGDDLIVPADVRESCLGLLESCWFKVNHEKTFWTGKFRESCGLESMNGCDVTPVYWLGSGDGKVDTTASLVAQANNFHKKWLLHLSNLASSTAERRIRKSLPLVISGSTTFGVYSFTVPRVQRFSTRYSEGLQRWEVLIPSLVVKTDTGDARPDSRLLQYFTEEPLPFLKWESGPVSVVHRTKVRCRWAPLESILPRIDVMSLGVTS